MTKAQNLRKKRLIGEMTSKSKILLIAVAIFFLVGIIVASNSSYDKTQQPESSVTSNISSTIPHTPTEKANAYLEKQGKTCLSAEESWGYIGANNVCVRFLVQSIHRGNSGTVFLNSEVKGSDFSVVSFYSNPITYADAKGYLGGNISVRGDITEYENQPQIVLKGKSDIYDVVTAQEREENQRKLIERMQSEEYTERIHEMQKQFQERQRQLQNKH